jgi:hypothetical protein
VTGGAGLGGDIVLFDVLPRFSINGSAAQMSLPFIGGFDAAGLRLTPSDSSQRGSAWLPTKERVAWGFRSTFQLRVTEPRGFADTDGSGADGFAFVIQNDGLSALGGAGRELGYAGIPNSLAIEFDTWQNSELGDPNSNHISVHTRGTMPNSADETGHLGLTSAIPYLSDGGRHRASIRYLPPDRSAPGFLAVYVDDAPIPDLSLELDLSQVLRLDNGRAFIGFTASTGGASDRHEILRWELH